MSMASGVSIQAMMRSWPPTVGAEFDVDAQDAVEVLHRGHRGWWTRGNRQRQSEPQGG